MPGVLHLVKTPYPELAGTVIQSQLESGDAVTVALLPGIDAPALPAGVTIRRVPDDLTYPELLDLIFAADHVISW